MTQMNWSFSGGSTSDCLTGGSGGWIDAAFGRQDDY